MYSIICYCSDSHIKFLEKTIRSWVTRKNVEKIFLFMECTNDQKISGLSEKIFPISIFDPSKDIGLHCARKAESLQYILNKTEEENLLLLDVDCLIMKDVGKLFNEDFDIVATGYNNPTNISSGFLAVKNNIRTKNFVKEWVEAQIQCHETERSRDQKTLSNLFNKYYQKEKTSNRKTFLLLDYLEYNFHPEGNQKHQIDEWIKQINLFKNKIHILHFAFSTIKDSGIINRTIESYKGI